jgi:hypothetical protein
LIRACARRDGLALRGAGAGRKAKQEHGGSTAAARMAYLLPVAQFRSRALRQQPSASGLHVDHVTDADLQPQRRRQRWLPQSR